jgi:hypothetical protein
MSLVLLSLVAALLAKKLPVGSFGRDLAFYAALALVTLVVMVLPAIVLDGGEAFVQSAYSDARYTC